MLTPAMLSLVADLLLLGDALSAARASRHIRRDLIGALVEVAPLEGWGTTQVTLLDELGVGIMNHVGKLGSGVEVVPEVRCRSEKEEQSKPENTSRVWAGNRSLGLLGNNITICCLEVSLQKVRIHLKTKQAGTAVSLIVAGLKGQGSSIIIYSRQHQLYYRR